MPLAGSGQIVIIKQDGTDGSNYSLPDGSIDIGSGKDCDIRVPIKEFPNRQCSITVLKSQATLKNCSLVTSTLVNNTPVNEKVLDHRDIITFTVDIGRFRWDYLNGKASQRSDSNKLLKASGIMKPKLVKKTRKSIGRRKSEGVTKKVDHKTIFDIKTRRSLDTLPVAYSPKTRQVAVVKPQRRDMGNSSFDAGVVILTPLANHSSARKNESRSVGKGQSRMGNSADLVYYDSSSKRRKTNEVEKLDTPVVLDKNKRAALMLLTSRSPVNRGTPKSPAVKRSPKSPSTRITNENWPQMMVQNINVRESLAFDSNLSSKDSSNVPVLKLQVEKLTLNKKYKVNSKIPSTKGSSAVSYIRSSRPVPASTVSTTPARRTASRFSTGKASASAPKLTQARSPAVRSNSVIRPGHSATPIKSFTAKTPQVKLVQAKTPTAKIILQKTSTRSISKLPVKSASVSKITPMKSSQRNFAKVTSVKITSAKSSSIKKALIEASLVRVRSTPRRANVISIPEEKSPVKSSPKKAVPKKLTLEEILSPVPVKTALSKTSPLKMMTVTASLSSKDKNKTLSPLKKSPAAKSVEDTPVKTTSKERSSARLSMNNNSLNSQLLQIKLLTPAEVVPLKQLSLKIINDVTRKTSMRKGSPKKFTESMYASPLSVLRSPVKASPEAKAMSHVDTPDFSVRSSSKRTSKTPLASTRKMHLIVTPMSTRKGTLKVNTKGTPKFSPKVTDVSIRNGTPKFDSNSLLTFDSKVSPKIPSNSSKTSLVADVNKSTSDKRMLTMTPKLSPEGTPKANLKNTTKLSSTKSSQSTSKTPDTSIANPNLNSTRKASPRSSPKKKITPKSTLKSSLKTPKSTRKSAVKLKFKLTPRSVTKDLEDGKNVSGTSSYFNLSSATLSSPNFLGESTLLYSSAKSTPAKESRRSQRKSTIAELVVNTLNKRKSSTPLVESSSSSFLSTRTSRNSTTTSTSQKSVEFFTPKSGKKLSVNQPQKRPYTDSKTQSSTAARADSSLISSIRTAFNVLNNSQINLKSALKSPDSKSRRSGRKSGTIKFDLSNVESPTVEVMEIGRPSSITSKVDSPNRSVRSSRSSLAKDMFIGFNRSDASANFDDDEDESMRYSFNTSVKGNNSRVTPNKSDMFFDSEESYIDLSTVFMNDSSSSQSSSCGTGTCTSASPRQSGRKFLSESIGFVTPKSKQNSLEVQKKTSPKNSVTKGNIMGFSPIVSPKVRSPRTPAVQSKKETIVTTPNLGKLFEMQASTPKVAGKPYVLMEANIVASRLSSTAKDEKKSPGERISRKSSAFSQSNSRKSLRGVVKTKVDVRKSNSMNLSIPRKSRRGDMSTDQASNSSGGTDVNAPCTDNEIVITPKTTMKLIPEVLKEKHSTAKKSTSRKTIIDHLTDLPDLAKELFASPVKRKLSQSMRQYNASFRLDDIEDAGIRDASFELLNSSKKRGRSGKTSDISINSGNLKTPNVSSEMFVSPIPNSLNKKVASPGRNNSLGERKVSVKSTKTSTNTIVKTPRVQKSPKNALINFDGVKKLFSSPARKQKSPKNDLLNIVSVKSFYNPPQKKARSPKNDLSDVKGVKQLLKTPRNTQKSPRNDLTNVAGVKSLFGSKNRSPRNDLTSVAGVKALLKTPGRVQKSPKNELVNVSAVKTLFTSKGKQKSPLNDLTRVVGIKKIFSTPKVARSPANNLGNISGLEKIFETSCVSRNSPKTDAKGKGIVGASARILSPTRAEKSISENMFDSFTGTTPVRTYSKGRLSSVNSQKSSSFNVTAKSVNVSKSSVKKDTKYTETSTILAVDSANNSQNSRSRRQLTIDRTIFSFEVSKVEAALKKNTKKDNDPTELSILGQSTPANRRKKPSVNVSVINIRHLSPILSLSKSDPAASPIKTESLRGKRSSGKAVKQIPAKKKKIQISPKLSPVKSSPKQASPVKKVAANKRAPKKEKKIVEAGTGQPSPKAEPISRSTRGKKSQVAKQAKDTSTAKNIPAKGAKVTRSKKVAVKQTESVDSVEIVKKTRGRPMTSIGKKPSVKATVKKATLPAESKKKVTFAPDITSPVKNVQVVKSRSTRSNKAANIKEMSPVKVIKPTRSKVVVKKTNAKSTSTATKKENLAKNKTTPPKEETTTTRKRKRGASEAEVVQPKIKKANTSEKVSAVKVVAKSIPVKKTSNKSAAVSKISPVKVTRSTRQRK